MNLIQSNVKTMSSREIAKLTGSSHDSVRKSARRLEAANILTSPLAESDYKSRGKVYQEFNFNKRDSLVLVARLSPEFTAAVVDRWQALEDKQLEEAKLEATRNTAKLEAPFMTKAVKFTRDAAGKKSQHFHFSNEFNLINQVALGMTAKKYRELHGLEPSTHLRDTLTTLEIACIEHLQRANTTMIEIGMDYQKRKCELSKIYTQRHARGLIDEVKRLEY